jgi:hypothetical protein
MADDFCESHRGYQLFLYNQEISFPDYIKASGKMRTAAYNDDVASNHRRR